MTKEKQAALLENYSATISDIGGTKETGLVRKN